MWRGHAPCQGLTLCGAFLLPSSAAAGSCSSSTGVLWSLAVGSLFPLFPSGAAQAVQRPGATACMCGGCPGENTISTAPPPDTSAVLWSFGEHLQGAQSSGVGTGGSAVRVPIPGVSVSLENVTLSQHPSCLRAPQHHTPVGFTTHLLCDRVSLAF